MVKKKIKQAFSFTQEQVVKFAECTGDMNPIHLDDQYAKKSIFGQKIIHGFLSGSVFSKIFGTVYPGKGTIYLKQDMVFLKPMYVDQEYSAVLELIETIPKKATASYKTEIYNNNDQCVFTGKALIRHDIYN